MEKDSNIQRSYFRNFSDSEGANCEGFVKNLPGSGEEAGGHGAKRRGTTEVSFLSQA